MTIEFKEQQIIEKEKATRKPYIGYFAPNGTLIDFNLLLGMNTHTSSYNPVSWAFISWVSYILQGTSTKKYKRTSTAKLFPYTVKNNEYLGIDEFVIRGYQADSTNFGNKNSFSFDYFLEMLNKRIDYFRSRKSLNDYEIFEYQLLLFFNQAYQNRRFFECIGRDITVENPDIVKERIKKQYSKCSLSESELGGLYLRNLRIQLFSYMKDICIQFLGYDALERFNAISLAEIAIPDKNEEYNFDFLGNPRIITTACFNPNEKYFNWQIMDYQIQNVPKYNYNTLTRTFEEVPDISTFHQRHSEEIYGQEIACIRKLVPKDQRYKYFIER